MEEKYPVIEGAESFYLEGNKVGILISHGFIGTPQSVQFLGEKLAELGFTVLAPRLKGHGTHYYDLEECSHEEWLASLEKGYRYLKERCSDIFVIGQSMGGTLTLWLASKYADIKGIMLINPALTIPTLDYLKEDVTVRFIDENKPDIKANGVYEITYEKAPVKSIRELQELMALTPSILSSVSCPIMGFKSPEDHVVPAHNTDYIIQHVNSTEKKVVVLPNSYHVASMDNDKDKIVEQCGLFIQRNIRKGLVVK